MDRDEYYIALEKNKAQLEHHGIKGQKWGIRRWQNPDGTLTEAGKEHYGYKVLPRELFKQAFYESVSPEERKASRVVAPTMFGVMGAFPGAVEGGLVGGPLGAVLGGIGGATAGGILGYSVDRLLEKMELASYEKSKKKVNMIVEKYGDEKVDGDKIKELVELYRDGIKDKVSAYRNNLKTQILTQDQIAIQNRQANEAHQRFMNEVNQQNFQRFMDDSSYQAMMNPLNMQMLGMM